MEYREKMFVSKIRRGTVIDHIPAGKGIKILKILGLETSNERYALISNVESRKLGVKDIVKIENKILSNEELAKIAIIARNATINIIENFEVVRKFKPKLPKLLVGIIRCPNPRCISNADEPIVPKFVVEKEEPLRLRCYYCERPLKFEDHGIEDLLL